MTENWKTEKIESRLQGLTVESIEFFRLARIFSPEASIRKHLMVDTMRKLHIGLIGLVTKGH